MDELLALWLALGHVRSAVVAFVSADDPTGESLFLAAECLDLEGLFGDFGVVPQQVDPGLDAIASLDAASNVLVAARQVVPLALWAALQAVRARAAR